MEPSKLREHVFSTYITLRYGLAVVAFALPFVLYVAGKLDGLSLQDSISAYYWATGTGANTARVWLVGGIFAIAAGLYLYKGFTVSENLALNAASLLGAGAAVVPMEWDCASGCGRFSVHGFCAVAMFICLVYVVWFRAKDTLKFLPGGETGTEAKKYKRRYAVIGFVMALTPIAAFVLISILGKKTAFVFFIESLAVWAFAAFWYVKSRELKKSQAVSKALLLNQPVESTPTATSTWRPLVIAAGVGVAAAVLVAQFKLIQPTFEGAWRVVEVTTPDGVTTRLPGSEIYTFFAPRQYVIVRFTSDKSPTGPTDTQTAIGIPAGASSDPFTSYSGTYQLVDGILTMWPPGARTATTKPFSRVSFALRGNELTMAEPGEQDGQLRNGSTRKLVRVK